ncbi:glycosyltransferase [Longispora sp. NPDC051575]|uniref:glycosyltransferase n=1 Tax=Longispora sp. NPDC051575 TaxID=3154943 RepID=UPI003424A8BC
MRILFTFIGGSGHFHPLVPVARAAEAAGHTVAVAGSGVMVAAIGAAGFTVFPTSPPRPRLVPVHGPLEATDPAEEERNLREGFAGTGARRHAAVLPGIVEQWRPDLMVRDEVDFGAALVAELLDVPCATVLVLAAGTFLRPEIVAEPLHALRAELGLPPDPELAVLERGLVLSPFAPTFRSPAAPLPPTTLSYRTSATAPARVAGARPTVYFTLGTIYTNPDLHTRVLAGLRELPADIVMTVGEHIDPARFGPQPAHVRIERFIPQDELLPRCDVVVSHGGSGSVTGTLAHGLPAVLLPMGADQPHNAARCVELGVGRVVDPVTATPEDVRDAVSAVLAEPAHRRAAARIQAEIGDLPPVAATVAALERLRG